MPSEDNVYRIDLLQEIEWFDEKNNRMCVKWTPNPERYEWKIINGKKCLCDKLEDVIIPEEVYHNVIMQMEGKGLYWVRPTIDSNLNYINERTPKMRSFLESQSSNYEFRDKSEEFLNSLSIKEMPFVILCIDLKGSTQLSRELSLQDNAKVTELFLKEMSLIVGAYHGYVLKYVGDGLIAYFPEPNFLGMEDVSVDCAVTMKFIIERAINPILVEKNLPELKFRIGLDSGKAIISTVGDASTKQHKDLIGLTISFASKIQGVARENGIVIGESVKKQIHTTRKVLFEKYSPENWNYKGNENSIYQLHSLMSVEPY